MDGEPYEKVEQHYETARRIAYKYSIKHRVHLDEYVAEAYYWLWVELVRNPQIKSADLYKLIRRGLLRYHWSNRTKLEHVDNIDDCKWVTGLLDSVDHWISMVCETKTELVVFNNWAMGLPLKNLGIPRNRVAEIKAKLMYRLGYKPRKKRIAAIPSEEPKLQTFVPSSLSYRACAKLLDNKRLGKQRVECKQILRALDRQGGGWYNHPATVMWSQCVDGLIEYAIEICTEWRARGFKDQILEYFHERTLDEDYQPEQYPKWWGVEVIHESHRSNLLRKDEYYYRQHGWLEDTTLPYVWPLPNGSIPNRPD